ncbi:MAG TPA: hypothetical protein PKL31_08160 [Fulvivirga sp.]|nr:hypothetical protein [Fulvivirga sp.]
MSEKEKHILSQLRAYKRKHFFNLIVKGLLITFSTLLILFLVFNYLEYTFQFGVNIRTVLFFTFILLSLVLMIKYVLLPATKLTRLDRAMGDEYAALNIGKYFPEISDKLLNIIQLRRNNERENQLVVAGIHQKLEALPNIEYQKAITLKQNNYLLPWLVIPVLITLFLFIIKPEIITGSTERITNYNTNYIPKAPFNFELLDRDLRAFRNEDFTIHLLLTGNAIPKTVYINTDGRKLKMAQDEKGVYSYTFKKIQQTKRLSFESAGFTSTNYRIDVESRPNLRSFNMYLEYPGYLRKKNERLSNVGNVQVPEGTSIKWQLHTLETDTAKMKFLSDKKYRLMQLTEDQIFEFDKTINNSERYEILLANEYSENKEPILYNIDVIKDQYPRIESTVYQDTTLYQFIGLGGNIFDDYGLSELQLFYSIDNNKHYKSKPIKINKNQNSQRYYFNWAIDSLIKNGQAISFYLQVWDNDQVNGRKSTKTGVYNFKVPSKKEIQESLSKVAKQTEDKIDRTLQEAKELKEQLNDAENRTKGKKELNWQDKKLIKDLIEKKEQLNKAIEELKEQNKNNDIKRDRFTDQDEKIRENVKKLQELMDELLDEETKKLYQELQELLDKNEQIENIQDILDKINNKETNLEKELERTLELFKKMKFEYELNEAVNELNKQLEDQKDLQEKTAEKKNKDSQLPDNQEELNNNFKDLQEQLEQLKESNQEMKNPESLPDTNEEEQNIEESQKEGKELLEQQKNKKATEKQQKAIDNMKQMAAKMQQMQSSMEMQSMQENLNDLRAIVYNLLRLSFEQEDLMDEFTAVKQSDPRFIELSQKQLNLKDDSQIVQDSLLSLANRVFQIASFVTREVTEMNAHMDKAVDFIKERKKPQAVSEQQFAMTSMNNLALLLDDVLQQMQEAMADAMGKPQKNKGNQKMPSLSELQKQLNGKIEELKESGKSGRALSEELAKLAAEQERIRKALQDAQNKMDENNGSKPGNGIPEKMEETENDLVNKKLTQETINRQREILSRLLEAEDALRERDKEEERKSETAKDHEKAIPKAFEEYFRLKEQEIEFLKTIPPKLYPYYKNEVNEYFRRIGNESHKIESE